MGKALGGASGGFTTGKKEIIECDQLISTLPATTTAAMLGEKIDFQYNSISLVYLNINRSQVMPYHWAYFADESIVINRMAEFKNFTTSGIDITNTVLCAEVTTHSNTPSEDVISALVSYGLIEQQDVPQPEGSLSEIPHTDQS